MKIKVRDEEGEHIIDTDAPSMMKAEQDVTAKMLVLKAIVKGGTTNLLAKKTYYYSLVGRKGNEYYFCDYTYSRERFLKGGGYHYGAVGTVIKSVTFAEWEQRTAPDGLKEAYKEWWKNDVACNKTELGLTEYGLRQFRAGEYEPLLDIVGESRAELDLRYLAELERHGVAVSGFKFFEFSDRGWRCFSDKSNSDFEEVFNPSLLREIERLERQDKKRWEREHGHAKEDPLRARRIMLRYLRRLFS